jgi:hypothetical protein
MRSAIQPGLLIAIRSLVLQGGAADAQDFGHLWLTLPVVLAIN